MTDTSSSFTSPPLPANDYLMRVQYYPQVFSAEECARIRALPGDVALTEHYRMRSRLCRSEFERQSHYQSRLLPFEPSSQWLFDRLNQIIYSVNQEFFQFEITSLAATQLVVMEAGDRLDWHLELGDGEFAKRKLTLLLFLSEPHFLSGGRMDFGSTPEPPRVQSPGSIFIFPAYMMTQIQPVQAGQLCFLQTWAQGAHAFI
jgi:hypothetical protein